MTDLIVSDSKLDTDKVIEIIKGGLASKALESYQVSLYDIISTYTFMQNEIKRNIEKCNEIFRKKINGIYSFVLKVEYIDLLTDRIMLNFYYLSTDYKIIIKKDNDDIFIEKITERYSSEIEITGADIQKYSDIGMISNIFNMSLPTIKKLFQDLDNFNGFYDNNQTSNYDVSGKFFIQLSKTTANLSINYANNITEILRYEIFSNDYKYIYTSSRFIDLIKGKEEILFKNIFFCIENIPSFIVKNIEVAKQTKKGFFRLKNFLIK